MKISLLLLASWLLCPALFSQTEKGASPIPSTVHPATSTPEVSGQAVTRAVVVGISDYQSTAIQDLRFANRDAEEFADYLRSPAGGSLPAENVQVLTNEKATQGKMVAAFGWLTAETKPGDLAIIYFSGHGDVEIKSAGQLGFLLCFDAPPASYKAGGAYSLFYLQDDISTISANGGKVVLVLDACHAGKLAGSDVGGTSATATALTRQFADEVKIMSCQPSELSYEGEQWGGGRGVFSFNLVEGLKGLADKNSDGTVNLLEIGRYLEEVVPAETAPNSQIPMTYGEKNTLLARVDALTMAEAKKEQENRRLEMSKLDTRGMDLASLDTATQQLYNYFQAALDSDNLIQPEGESAWDYFQSLSQAAEVKSLRELMRRNLAAALQDEVQQAMNALLEADPAEVNQWRFNPAKYVQYPTYLERAIALLGEKHYMYRSLMSKKLYFEGYLFAKKTVDLGEGFDRDSLRKIAKDKYLQAVKFEPTAAYIYQAIASLYYYTSPPQTDSVLVWNALASQWSPQWLLPYLDNAYEINRSTSNVAAAEHWLQKAMAADSNAYVVLERLSWLYQWQGNIQESLDLCDRMIALKPDLFNAYSTKGVTYLMRLEYMEAERTFDQSLKLDASYGNWAHYYMANLFAPTRRMHRAVDWVQKIWDDPTADVHIRGQTACYLLLIGGLLKQDFDAALWADRAIGLKLSPVNDAMAYVGHGMVQVQAGKDEEGRLLFLKSLEANPADDLHQVLARVYLGMIEARKGNVSLADSTFQEAFDHISQNDLDNQFSLHEGYFLYGDFLLRQHRYEEARQQFRIAETLQPLCFQAQYGYALLAAASGKKKASMDYLEKALLLWYPETGSILKEPLFKKIRKGKRFKALMEKHFPK